MADKRMRQAKGTMLHVQQNVGIMLHAMLHVQQSAGIMLHVECSMYHIPEGSTTIDTNMLRLVLPLRRSCVQLQQGVARETRAAGCG